MFVGAFASEMDAKESSKLMIDMTNTTDMTNIDATSNTVFD